MLYAIYNIMGVKYRAKLVIILNALLFCEDIYIIKYSALSYQVAYLFVLKLFMSLKSSIRVIYLTSWYILVYVKVLHH